MDREVEVRVVNRHGRKYIILPYSYYKKLIKTIDEIIDILERLEKYGGA